MAAKLRRRQAQTVTHHITKISKAIRRGDMRTAQRVLKGLTPDENVSPSLKADQVMLGKLRDARNLSWTGLAHLLGTTRRSILRWRTSGLDNTARMLAQILIDQPDLLRTDNQFPPA